MLKRGYQLISNWNTSSVNIGQRGCRKQRNRGKYKRHDETLNFYFRSSFM